MCDKAMAATTIPTGSRSGSAAKSGMLTNAIRREMRRRAAIEAVISHCRMRRNHLKGCHGDRINAVLAAPGYNFSLLLRWSEELLHILSLTLWRLLSAPSCRLNWRSKLSSRRIASALRSPSIARGKFRLKSRERRSATVLGGWEHGLDIAHSTPFTHSDNEDHYTTVCSKAAFRLPHRALLSGIKRPTQHRNRLI
jgi:hypothetical protein